MLPITTRLCTLQLGGLIASTGRVTGFQLCQYKTWGSLGCAHASSLAWGEGVGLWSVVGSLVNFHLLSDYYLPDTVLSTSRALSSILTAAVGQVL